MLFTSDKSPFMRYLPENNKMANRISTEDVLNICTSFEIEYGLCTTPHKDKTVNDYETRQCDRPIFCNKDERKRCDKAEYCWKKGSTLAKKIWFLYSEALTPQCDKTMESDRKSICDFALLRNDIVRNGNVIWGNNGKFSVILVRTLYTTILMRAGLDKADASKIAEAKWDGYA